jgi:3-mercaptopyruvate sulfurtransferase SseA
MLFSFIGRASHGLLCAGLTACILIWSLHVLGRKDNVYLYDGSFSEWCVS